MANKYAEIQKTNDNLSTENTMIVQKRNTFKQQLAQRTEELRTAREENVALAAENGQLKSQMKELKGKVSDTVSTAVSEAIASLLKE